VRELADLLVHQEALPKIRELAYLVAAAQIDIVRVSKARYELVGNTLGDDGFETTWQRNNREMIMKHESELPPDSYQRVMTALVRKPKGEEKVALVFSELSEQLLRLERYERRARSRRRKAIRAFDLATRRKPRPVSPCGRPQASGRAEMAERTQIPLIKTMDRHGYLSGIRTAQVERGSSAAIPTSVNSECLRA
jgi:hypothetical protein